MHELNFSSYLFFLNHKWSQHIYMNFWMHAFLFCQMFCGCTKINKSYLTWKQLSCTLQVSYKKKEIHDQLTIRGQSLQLTLIFWLNTQLAISILKCSELIMKLSQKKHSGLKKIGFTPIQLIFLLLGFNPTQSAHVCKMWFLRFSYFQRKII